MRWKCFRAVRATSGEKISLDVARGDFLSLLVLPKLKVSAAVVTAAVAGAGGCLGRTVLSTNNVKLGDTSWCHMWLSGCSGRPSL